jgi:protein involved in polysaccharide export with SLBB domain
MQLGRAQSWFPKRTGCILRVATKWAAILAALTLLNACGSVSRAVDDATAALPESASYRLAPGDKLKVNVFNETDLTGEYQVTDRGSISVPLIGEIRAAGYSVEQFRQSLVEALKNGYVRNPRVTVEVVNYRPINVIGEVRNAGQYTYRPGISVADAVAMAGGYTYRANTNVVYVTRAATSEQITVDLKTDDAQVHPGDKLRVPERYF